MTAKMNAVLERVLSEELGRQAVWMVDDKKMGFPTDTREEVVKEIKEFMKQNDIKIREDFYLDGINKAQA